MLTIYNCSVSWKLIAEGHLIGNCKFQLSSSETTKYLPEDTISFPFLKKIMSKHSKSWYFGQLNTNSIRNKFESVQEIIQNTLDIFVVCKTKIDSSFSNDQFCIPDFCIFLKDRNACGGGLLFYVNQDLNCKVLNKTNTLVIGAYTSFTKWYCIYIRN